MEHLPEYEQISKRLYRLRGECVRLMVAVVPAHPYLLTQLINHALTKGAFTEEEGSTSIETKVSANPPRGCSHCG